MIVSIKDNKIYFWVEYSDAEIIDADDWQIRALKLWLWFYNEHNSITEDEYNKILSWYEYIDWVLTETEYSINRKNDLLKSIKKQECREKILTNYSETDQQNIQTEAIASGDNTELVKMKDFIFAMVTEYQTNWKDVDFSNINP